jgi:restriction endonuclease Mrr
MSKTKSQVSTDARVLVPWRGRNVPYPPTPSESNALIRERNEAEAAEKKYANWKQQNRTDEEYQAQREIDDAKFAETCRANSGSTNAMDRKRPSEINGVAFELQLKEAFEAMGYQVEMTPKSGDQGVDLLLISSGNPKKKIAIQAKRYAAPVGNAAVQEVYAGRAFYSASLAAVVTNATFTEHAKRLAKRLRVRLIDGSELTQWLSNKPHQPFDN